MHNKKKSSFILIFCSISSFAFASRVVQPPPLSFITVHGGSGIAANPAQVCTTADMLVASNYNASGVDHAQHDINVALKNISSIDQTVEIDLLNGSLVSSANSGGTTYGIPQVISPTAPSLAVPTGGYTIWGPTVIPANGSTLVTVGYACSSSSCMISPINGPIPADCSSFAGAAPQVCILQSSYTLLKITVLEDRGAMLANITTIAHRGCGNVDHYLTPPPSLAVNGGRPF